MMLGREVKIESHRLFWPRRRCTRPRRWDVKHLDFGSGYSNHHYKIN